MQRGKQDLPELSEDGKRRAGARQERQSRALRANLARRKSQQRARDQGGAGSETDSPEDEAPSGL